MRTRIFSGTHGFQGAKVQKSKSVCVPQTLLPLARRGRPAQQPFSGNVSAN
jgi:hypothetical protein